MRTEEGRTLSLGRRQVSIRVGAERPDAVRAERPRMALVGVGPMAWPNLAAAFPAFVVAQRGHADGGPHVVHLRLPPSADRARVPGLDARVPSRLRDALVLAHAGGLEHVDVIVARARGLTPWDLSAPAAVELLEPTLEAIPGVSVCMPDAMGPPQRGRMIPPAAVRLGTVVMATRRWAPTLAAQYQTLFVDLPSVDEGLLYRAMEDMNGVDAALVSWQGNERALARHGFRPGSSLVAAMAASSPRPSDSLVGRRVSLPGGRPLPSMRLADLGVPIRVRDVPEVAARAVVPLQLDAQGDTVQVLDEPTLRRPAGTWSLPMVRTAKLVHHRVVIAANALTFREANEEQALLLQAALLESLSDLERRGIIGGAKPGERVEIHTAPYRNPVAPALVADVTVYLRPWLKRVHIDLALRPSGTSLEVT